MTDAIAQFEAKISPTLKAFVRPLTDAVPHPENIRRHGISAIARSLTTFGQRTVIVVQASSGFICKGNGTWEAAKTLGWTELAQDWQDFDDATALKYLLADNKTSDVATYQRDKAYKLLSGIAKGPGLFDTLWDMNELEDLAAEAGIVSETDAQEFKGDYADAGAEAATREQRAAVPGEKMKEIPVVLSRADHANFIGWISTLKKVFGTTGVIATIVEAVRRQAEGTPSGAVPIGNAEEVRVATLKDARDYFLVLGKPSFQMGEIAAFFQTAMRPMQPEIVEEKVVEAEGQLSMAELLS